MSFSITVCLSHYQESPYSRHVPDNETQPEAHEYIDKGRQYRRDEVIYCFSVPAKKLVAMVASSTCENVLNKWVGALGFTCPFQPSGLWFHAHFRLNIAGLLPSSWILLSSDELLEEPKNPSKNISLHLSFESLSCFLNLEWHATAILQLNFVYTNEKSINVMLKPLDGMNMQWGR